VSNILIGLLAAVLTTNQPPVVSNIVEAAKAAVNPNDPVEREYEKLLDSDDEAQKEVDRWIQENQQFASQGAGLSRADLNRRILARFKPVQDAYEDFLKRNPEHVRAYIAYGSFLNDIGDEEGARTHWEKALDLDKTNPAIYNNLANIYGHTGPVKKAFEFYEKAIELNPREPVYFHNFGTVVYLFRKDVKEHYGISEDQVFAKAFGLYSNSMRLDPASFPLASDVAQTYYGIRPMRTEEALNAWTNAFKIANDDIEREGVHIHFARIKLMANRLQEAQRHLDAVTNTMYAELKGRVQKNLDECKSGNATNSPGSVAKP
jgi:tetratricopeptide (TPR) repeat protein